MFRWLGFSLAFFLAAQVSSASACSMDPEWVKPSNFELVEMSDAIVIATAAKGKSDEVEFTIERSIKGSGPATVARAGLFEQFGTAAAPSDQVDLQAAHPSSYAGPCSRSDFTAGKHYLLFLQQARDGAWSVASDAFSRTMEDYGGEGSTWTRTVRRYVDIDQRHPPMERLSVLAAMLQSGNDQFGRVLEPSEKIDIEQHLSSLSPYKPTAYLLQAYEALEHGKLPSFGVRSRDADRERSAADLLTREMFGDQLEPSGPDLKSMKAHILTSLVNGEHPDAMPLFRRLFAEAAKGNGPENLAPSLRFLAKHGAYAEAFHWVELNLFKRLSGLNRDDQRRLMRAIADLQQGDDYDNPRWKSDPHAATAWPELALRLWHWEVERWGPDEAYPFDDAISTIPLKDYRSRPDLTLALAAGYDEGVQNWATQLLEGGGPAAEVRLPLQVILHAWTAEHGPLLEREFCRGGERRLQLIELVGREGDELYEGILLHLGSADLTPVERKQLDAAVSRWKKRFGEEPQPSFNTDGSSLKVEPLVCESNFSLN